MEELARYSLTVAPFNCNASLSLSLSVVVMDGRTDGALIRLIREADGGVLCIVRRAASRRFNGEDGVGKGVESVLFVTHQVEFGIET